MSDSSVSSPAASSRSAIAASQPFRDANTPRNSLIFGKSERSVSTSIRRRRGAVSSMNSVMRMATRPPAVMPFCSNPPATCEKYSGNTTPLWKPTPAQNEMPTTSPLR